MRQMHVAVLLGGLFVMDARAAAPQTVPPSGNISQARVAWTFSAARLCPELQASEDGGGAMVLFRVGRTGSPSQVAIRYSSQSAELDEAALQCVQRLRFQPATRLGDGEPIESWQQMAWMWAPQPPDNAGGRGETPPPQIEAKIEPKSEGRVTVRACADQDGKMSQDPLILHSSGKPQLDEAALQIARLGAAYYPQHEVGEGRKPGCARLVIDFGSR
ncbi:MAG: TonB family protein [Sinobacteraceae bacterium]|nr:TonB family protein [Nevskiaceae bacterium]